MPQAGDDLRSVEQNRKLIAALQSALAAMIKAGCISGTHGDFSLTWKVVNGTIQPVIHKVIDAQDKVDLKDSE